MRRLGRSMLNAATALSLALCVATCMLKLIVFTHDYQITSYGKTYVGPRIVREHLFFAQPGQVAGYIRCSANTTKPLGYYRFGWIPGVLFQWDWSNGVFFEFGFDFWFLLAVGAALPLVRLIEFVRHRLREARAARGPRCRSCGYNLTGNVSGICPECGITITSTLAPPH